MSGVTINNVFGALQVVMGFAAYFPRLKTSVAAAGAGLASNVAIALPLPLSRHVKTHRRSYPIMGGGSAFTPHMVIQYHIFHIFLF